MSKMALSDFKLIILKGHLTNQLTSSLRWQFEGQRPRPDPYRVILFLHWTKNKD